MQADVRKPVYRGSQMVRALWFDAALIGEAEARHRLLAAWVHGARAWRLRGGYLLEWPQARRLQCERAPGLPFCDQDGILASAPLLQSERAGIVPGTAVLVLGASLHDERLTPDLRIDPSAWLDVSSFPIGVALAMPPAPGSGFVAGVPAAAPDVRAVLGDAVPPASPQRAAFLGRTQQARKDSGSTPMGTARMLGGTVAAAAVGAAGLAAGLLAQLRRGVPGGSSNSAGTAARLSRAPAPSGWRERLAGLAMLTRVSRLLGWRQANYLRRMIQRFEKGDLDEALRHAIPLDSPHAGNSPAFGVPGRRNHLDIGGTNAGTGAIGLAPDIVQFLRNTYQRSFDQLDRAGRIDEAAFVLAELMHRHQEAVDYLERKGRAAQAAQLAETLGLAPALIVRLHCMAGNAGRAVVLARLRGGFGDAVAELERRHHAAAPALRLEWAQSRAARGDLVEAASAIWPLPDQRHNARAWLQAAEGAGGTLGVQGLIFKLALDPDARHGSGTAVQNLLHAPGDEAVRQRMRACDCLLKLDQQNAVTRRLAAELWRRLLADRAASLNTVSLDHLKKLLALADDPVLANDAPKISLPALPAPPSLRNRSTPLRVSFDERGLLPLEDVRRLPDGGWLLALGEAGIALTRADGTELVRFPIPAHRLVLARNGRQALALARREKVMRVSRIDLVQRKASDWFSARLDFWADEYDGSSWNVVAEERLMALDVAAAGQSVLWQVRDLPGKIVGFAQQGDVQALLMAVDGVAEQWRYALPQRRLMGRNRWPVEDTISVVLPDCAHELGTLVRFHDHDADQQTAVLAIAINASHLESRIALHWLGDLPEVSLHGDLWLLKFSAEDGWHCQVIDHRCRALADIVLQDADDARANAQDGYVLVWDKSGRVVEVDVAMGAARIVTFS